MDELTKLSPKEIMDIYLEAKYSGDTAKAVLLEKIIYFDASIPESERQAKTASLIVREPMSYMGMVSFKVQAEYEKIIDNETAEVGVVMYVKPKKAGITVPFVDNRVPAQKVVMKKDENIWKYHYDKSVLTEEQLIEILRKNHNDADAYYLLGKKYQSENPYRADRYFKRYYELEPNGFWVSKEFLSKLETGKDIQKQEQIQLDVIQTKPEKSSKSSQYIKIGQLFTAHGDYDKAEMYLDKAKEELKKDPYDTERYNKARNELSLRKSGEYFDILDEIEKSQNK
ncbi:MAG: hypothetical protein JW871_02965 [Endomicrobiales bacterium]|nr:hypothetical protein [Endomicrobiales bacterium]